MPEKSIIELMEGVIFESDNDSEEKEDSSNVSMWVKDKEHFIPSTDVTIYNKLPPGLYQVNYSNNSGLYCKNLDLKVDELYEFSDSITKSLLSEVSDFWEKSELYKENNLVHKRGILLCGSAGTGKTSYINMLSKELIDRGGIVFKVSSIRGFEHYVEFIKYGFRKIEKSTPIITILEDIDQYMNIETELLDFLDGQFHLDHHVILATSNNTEDLPDTILRPSRLDLLIEVPNPSETTRKEYFEYKKVDPEIINTLVEKSNNFSFADLKELYICVFVFGFTIDDAVDRIINKTKIKKNYLLERTSRIQL